MQPSELLSAFAVLAIILFAGAFGGFVDGLVHQKTYCLRLGHRSVDLGSLGDALVGATASVAMFTVAGAVFGIQWNDVAKTEHFIRIVAWGVLSGYAGIRLLNPLSISAVERIATSAAKQTMRESARQDTEMQLALIDANLYLNRYDMQNRDLARQGRSADAEGLLKRAEANFDVVLSTAPSNSEALRGKAKIYRRMADRASQPDKAKYWDLAIGILSDMIRRDDRAALAYYNRGCYEALTGKKDDALADLRQAVGISDKLKDAALADPDFDPIRGDPRFGDIVGRAETVPPQLRSAI
jgi:hypothetical protein